MAKETMKPQREKDTGVLQEEIRKLAGDNYRERVAGKIAGDAFSDWLQAEKEVKRKHTL